MTFVPGPELMDSPLDRPLPFDHRDSLRIKPGPLPNEPPLVIVGGGVAGLTLATHLAHADSCPEFALVEHQPELVLTIRRRLRALEQAVLRSPYEHHISAQNVRTCEMIDFARSLWRYLTPVEKGEVRKAQSGVRSVVPVDIFEHFCGVTAAAHSVAERSHQAQVLKVVRLSHSDAYEISTDRGSIRTPILVWAGGESPRQLPADWHVEDRHILAAWEQATSTSSVVVLGAGLTAAQRVLQHLRAGVPTSWIMRSVERYQCADVDAAFFRPEGRERFRQRNTRSRLELLTEARRASIMFELRPELRQAEADGRLTVYRKQGRISASSTLDGVEVRTEAGFTGRFGKVVPCFGLAPSLPHVLAEVEVDAVDGLPVLHDGTLESSSPGLFFIGGLASLSVGPSSRNIDGARIGAQRITAELERRIQLDA